MTRVFSETHRANISAAMTGRKRGPYSAERRARQSIALRRVQGEVQNRPGVRIRKSMSRRGNMPPNYDAMLVRTSQSEAPRLKWARKLWQSYNLTVEAFAWLWREQGGRCALCGDTLHEHGRGRFAVDHCHASGAVRGILCGQCNHRMLARVERIGIAKIAAYLNRGCIA